MKNESGLRARAFLRSAGAVTMALFPLALMVAFALHFDTLSEFFDFELRYVPNSTREFMTTLSDSVAAARYTLAHGMGYLSLPLLLGTGLCLGYILFPRRPWLAILGVSLVCTGTIYMGGVFGSWLSFAAIGKVSPDQIEGALPALEALTDMQGPLLLTTMLSSLSLLGVIVLAIGLFLSRSVPRWQAALILLGGLTILVFTDLDNWMFLGAFLMLLGIAPISLKLLKQGASLAGGGSSAADRP